MNNYLNLLDKIDRFAASVRGRHEAEFACRPGCSECCVSGITVWRVEFDRVESYIKERLPSAAAPLTEGREPPGPCPLLDKACRCTIYEARPVVCRLWGLPQLSAGALTCCDKNFRNDTRAEDLSAADVVDMDTVLKTLAAINHVYCKERGLDPTERLILGEASR